MRVQADRESERERASWRVTSCCQARTHDVTLRLPSINWRQFGGKRQHGGLYTSMSIKAAPEPRPKTGAADLCNLPAALKLETATAMEMESESEEFKSKSGVKPQAAGPLPSVTVAQKKKKRPYLFWTVGPANWRTLRSVRAQHGEGERGREREGGRHTRRLDNNFFNERHEVKLFG